MKKKETLNQQLIKTRKTKKESERQQIRKKIEKSSRLLDNYYNTNIHHKSWHPSGTIKSKNKYTYGETGLGFSLPDSSQYQITTHNKKPHIHFVEFDYIDNNDIIIIIEHCSNCKEHQSHTKHINDIFYHFAKLLQKSIISRFPFIKVYLKPIEKENSSSRIGAFEVQMCMKISNKITIQTIFSKLNSGVWPSIYNILNKISTLVPLLNIKCFLYDKEEGLDNDDNNNDNNDMNNYDDLLPSRYQHIKVNLFQLNNKKIAQYSVEAMDALDIIFNPKRREKALNEEKEMKDKNSIPYFTNSEQLSIKRPSSCSGRSFNRLTSFRQNTTLTQRSNSNSFLNENNLNYTYIQNEIIDNEEMINRMKGKFLSAGYSNKEGIVVFQNVPYDTYIIEVESSKNFLSCGSILKFNKIFANKPKKEELYTHNKIFGLRKQFDAYLQVFIYSNKSDSVLNAELINQAKVMLIRSYGSEMGNNYANLEDKFELKENKKIKGRYEIITTPGKMKLNVFKEGYEQIDRDIELKCGENKINIQLI